MAESKSIAFDRAVEYYDATRGFPPGVPEHIGATIVKAGGLTQDSRVLEIGVGTGRIALPTAPHVRAYIGIDLSRPMMERLLLKHVGEPVYVANSDATRLPFPSHSFDAVIAVHVFHLIPNWRDAVREVARVLRSGAPLIHCVTRGHEANEQAKALQNVWEAAVPPENIVPTGIGWRDYDTFLLNEGWSHSHTEMYTFTDEMFSPQKFFDYRVQRLGSGTWHLTDEQIERGAQALRTYIAAHYPDPTQPISIESQFKALAYLPPTGK